MGFPAVWATARDGAARRSAPAMAMASAIVEFRTMCIF
jgi:hypothetical protein